MKFDYAIGNPPYQETKSSVQVSIWPDFIKESTKISDISCMIHPGRWVIPKKNAKNLQLELVNDYHLKQMKYYSTVDDIFPGIGLDGGVSITLFDKNYKGKPEYYIDERFMGEYNPDAIIFTTPFLEEAYFKVFNNIDSSKNMNTYIRGSVGSMGSTYGYDKRKHLKYTKDTPDGMKEPIKVWVNTDMRNSQGRFGWKYIEKDKLDAVPKWLFSSRKVMITNHGHAIHGGSGNVINNNPQICDKDSIGTAVLYFYPKHDRERELYLLKSLFMTKTARYLMSIKQRDRCCMGFECIPDYLELAKLLPEDEVFTDKWFYTTFNFSKELITDIENRVRPKTED